MYIYIYIYTQTHNYSSVNIKLILNVSCLCDPLTIVTDAFLFPIRKVICLILPLRLPSCMHLSVFPLFPCSDSIPVSG